LLGIFKTNTRTSCDRLGQKSPLVVHRNIRRDTTSYQNLTGTR
ncbi:unnamed protein product, partial [Tenebrio molitor]